jgi:hypothetical protein
MQVTSGLLSHLIPYKFGYLSPFFNLNRWTKNTHTGAAVLSTRNAANWQGTHLKLTEQISTRKNFKRQPREAILQLFIEGKAYHHRYFYACLLHWPEAQSGDDSCLRRLISRAFSSKPSTALD